MNIFTKIPEGKNDVNIANTLIANTNYGKINYSDVFKLIQNQKRDENINEYNEILDLLESALFSNNVKILEVLLQREIVKEYWKDSLMPSFFTSSLQCLMDKPECIGSIELSLKILFVMPQEMLSNNDKEEFQLDAHVAINEAIKYCNINAFYALLKYN